MPPRLIFIRHGETIWNAERRLQGQQDAPLTAKGRDQAAAVGRDLRRWLAEREDALPDPLYLASPLGRACHSMALMRTAMGLPPGDYATDPRLMEMGFGRWEGLTWSEIKARDPWAAQSRRGARWHFLPPEGESYAMLAARLEPFVASLDRDAIVVAHGGVARALMALLGGVSLTAAPQAEIWQGRILMFEAGACRWL